MQLDKARTLAIIKAVLKEDIGSGDITTSALIDKSTSIDTVMLTREDCVVCGLQIAEWMLGAIDCSVRFKPNCSDGDLVGAWKELAYIEGRAQSILKTERAMLNLVAFLSGIATKTRKFVDIAKPYGVKIMDTRKTIPLLRYLQKYAVFTGGGTNHRMGLYDAVLIKDNHIRVAGIWHRGSDSGEKLKLKDLVERARKNNIKGTVVEVEVESLAEFSDALSGKPDIIMLDNMTPDNVKACMDIRKLSKIKPQLEVSGGIDLGTIEKYAKTKVDMISVGSLTSSVEDIDMTLDIV
jgi:nicotinate-nucleotide pyrophosphorylase (carboxylating)